MNIKENGVVRGTGANVVAPAISRRLCSKPLSQRLASISTLLFYAGLVAIPFDNLPFAPSSGWATIAPIIFFVYVCFNLPELAHIRFNVPLSFGVVAIVALQCVNIFVYGLTMGALLDALFTFVLGLFFYLALLIRYERQKASFDHDGLILYRAYLVAFAYGLLWLFANEVGADAAGMFRSIERRYYDRLAFSFTEPSFITMHIFGVLFLYTYFVSDRKLARKMLILGGLFLFLAIVTKSSARCVIDTAVFIALLLVRTTWVERKHSARNLFLWTAVVMVVVLLILSSTRVQAILLGGFNEDGSAASRYFRIESMLYGFMSDPLAALFGYGPGNMAVPFQEGYDRAFASYDNAYMVEVVSLGLATSIGNIFSMPIRLISDVGLIGTILLTALLFWGARRKGIDPCVILMTMWLYVQFDSYAFYALWMLIYLFRSYDPHTMGASYFALFEKTSDRTKRPRGGLESRSLSFQRRGESDI